jgi:hypothetical protein
MRRRASLIASRSGVSPPRVSRICENVWSFHHPFALYFTMSCALGGRGTSIIMLLLLFVVSRGGVDPVSFLRQIAKDA